MPTLRTRLSRLETARTPRPPAGGGVFSGPDAPPPPPGVPVVVYLPDNGRT